MEAEIIIADIGRLSLPLEKLESERELENKVNGKPLIASLNICRFNDPDNSLQIIAFPVAET